MSEMRERLRDYAPGAFMFFGIVFIGLAVINWASNTIDRVNARARKVNAELQRLDTVQQRHAAAIQLLADQVRRTPLEGVARTEVGDE